MCQSQIAVLYFIHIGIHCLAEIHLETYILESSNPHPKTRHSSIEPVVVTLPPPRFAVTPRLSFKN